MPHYRFGDFLVDTDTVEVQGPDGIREVEPQVFAVIEYLAEHHDRMVPKEELLDNVWGNKFVSESALTTRIKQARRALDDDGARQWAIKTVHGRGYRFVAPLIGDAESSPTASQVSPATPAPPAGVAPEPLPDELRTDRRRPFCGRTDELAQCLGVLDTVAPDGPIGWVWILGEPGIGKSRLAAELAAQSHARGHRVVFGRNSEDLKVPYQPFMEVIGQLAGDRLGGEAGERTSEAREPGHAGSPQPGLAPLLPSAPARHDLVGAEPRLADDAGRRFELFESVADWITQRAADRPLTIVVDDVHWAADSTLQLLRHLQQRPGDAAVTIVLTARDTAPDASDPVGDLLATGSGRPRTTMVHLTGLGEDDAARLIGGGDVDLGEVMRQTAGNPLFLQALDPVDGSVHIEGAVRRRLNTLPSQVQDTLRLMSVLGLEFTLRVAAAAHDRDELELLDELEAATAARLLEDIGVDRFRFTHALVRSSLRDQLSSPRRSRMHHRIAVALERVFGDDPAHLPEVAFHTGEAAQADPALRPIAVDRLRRAAEAASERFSFEEASDLLRQARELASDAPPAERAELALAHGVAENRGGRSVPASDIFEEALACAREGGVVVLQVEAALRFEDARWRPGLAGGRSLAYVDAAAELLDAEAAAGRAVPDELDLRARLALARVRSLAMSGRRQEADLAVERALALAADIGSPTMEANVLSVHLGHLVLHRGAVEARPMVERLAELEPQILDGDVALHALHDRIMYCTLTGDFDESRRLVGVMADQQRRWRSSFWQFVRTNQEAMEAFYRGDLVASERLAEHCLALADRLPGEDGAGIFGLRMFLIRREQDRLSTVAPMIRTVVARAGSDALWTPGLAWLLAETGAVDEAAEVVSDLRATDFELPLDAMWSTVMAILTETLVRIGDADACRVVRARFARLAGMNVVTGSGQLCFGRVDRYLGMLSLAVGDLEEAEQQLGAALEGDDSGGSVLWANESRLWLSRVRRAQGYAAEADAMVRAVVAEATAAGLVRLAHVADDELVR